MIPYFIMLVGIPGSGKSKWSKEVKSETTVVVCPDEIRKEMCGDISNMSVIVEAWVEAKSQTVSLLKEGMNVILDATNVDASYWQDFIGDLPECQMVAKLFEVAPEVAYGRIEQDIMNNVDRANVPEYVVYRMYGQYLHTKKIICEFFTDVTDITDVEDWITDVEESKKRFGGHYKQEV